MISRIIINVICAIFAINGALAGEWYDLGENGNRFLFFSGIIRSGDVKSLSEKCLSLPAGSVKFVILDSPGGDLNEGIYLAEIIDRLSIDTIALKRTSCESACVVAFMGGKHRIAEAGATLGIHAPYRDSDTNPYAFLNPEGMATRYSLNIEYRKFITDFAIRQGISKEFVDLMFAYDETSRTKEIDANYGLKLGVFTSIMD